jgi:hypothetical protein
MNFSLEDFTAGVGAELHDLYVDLELIHNISADLTHNEDAVHQTGFQKYHVDQAVFGESSVGGSLGFHHSLAHTKVSETLDAVLKDLHAFRVGLQAFAKAVDNADTQSAADLKKRHSAVVALDKAAGFDHTHQINHYYHPHTPGGTHA